MPSNRDLQPLLDTQQNQLNLVFSTSDGIDAKALAILAANIAILIFIDQASLHVALWQTVVLYAPLLLSLIFDVVSMWPQDYLGAAANLDESQNYLQMESEALILQLLADTQAAIRHNTSINKMRLEYCFASIILTTLGFLILLLII